MPKPSRNRVGRLSRAAGGFLAALALAVSTLSQETVFQLRNGDRITGTVITESPSEIVIITSFAGELHLQPAQIERRGPATNAVAKPVAPAPVTSPKTNAAAATNLATSSSAPKSAPPAPLTPPAATNGYGFKKFLSEWSGTAQLGLSVGVSTVNRETFSGRAHAVHQHTPRLRNILDYDAIYGHTDTTLTDDRMDGNWKLEYDVSKRFLLYNAAGAGYDAVRFIDQRYDLGPGVGYRLLTLTNFVMKTEFGGNYQRQIFSNDTIQDRYSLRFAEDFSWHISRKLRLDERLELYPEVRDLSHFRVRLELALSYLFGNNLTMSLNVLDLYDTQLPPNSSNNDLQIRSMLGVKF